MQLFYFFIWKMLSNFIGKVQLDKNNYFSITNNSLIFFFQIFEFKFCSISYVLQKYGFSLCMAYFSRFSLDNFSIFGLRKNMFYVKTFPGSNNYVY